MARYSSTTTPLVAFDDSDADNIVGETTLNLSAGREDSVVGMVFADEAGDIYIEQSMDGQNWDISTTYAVDASDGKGFSEPIYAPYIRVRYVNGAADQGEFRLYARLSSAGDS